MLDELDDTAGSLELVKELAQEAQKSERINIEDMRKEYIRIGAVVHTFDVPPTVRGHVIETLSDLVAYANKIDENLTSIIWYSEEGIRLIIDDSDRRDRVLLPLEFSEQIRTLKYLSAKEPVLSQRDFISLLRYKLGFTNVWIINQFRKLDWVNGLSESSSIQHANTKLGKSITAEVAGVEQLPEELRIDVPVYCNAGEEQQYSILLGIEIDAVNHTFQLIPMPNEIERVISTALENIRGRIAEGLTKENADFYRGTP